MRYIISCNMVQPLKTEVFADSEVKALEILDRLLDNGFIPEDENYPIGYIENKQAHKILDEDRFTKVNKLDLKDALELAINELQTLGYNGLVIDKLEEQLNDIRAKA